MVATNLRKPSNKIFVLVTASLEVVLCPFSLGLLAIGVVVEVAA
jgi:hypothetical protein